MGIDTELDRLSLRRIIKDINKKIHENQAIIFILFFGFFLRVLVFFVYQPWTYEVAEHIVLTEGDTPEYQKLALKIIETGRYPEWTFLSTKRTPIYPYFIAGIYSVFGFKPWCVIFIQIVISSFSLFIVYHIALLFLKKQIAILSALIYAIDPYSILFSQDVMADTLFVFLLLLSIYIYILSLKSNNFFLLALCGFLLGITTLTKPVLQFFPFFVLPFVSILASYDWRKFTKQILVYLCCFILTISPRLYHNYDLYGSIGLTTITGSNLLFHNVAKLQSKVNNIPFKKAQSQLKKNAELKGSKQIANPFLRNALYKQIAMEYIKCNFVSYIGVHTSGIIYMYFVPGGSLLTRIIKHEIIRTEDHVNSFEKTSFFLLMKTFFRIRSAQIVFLSFSILVFYVGIYIFFVLATISMFKNKNYIFIILSLLLIFYFTIIIGPVGQARYRLPINPFIIMVSSVCIYNLLKKFTVLK